MASFKLALNICSATRCLYIRPRDAREYCVCYYVMLYIRPKGVYYYSIYIKFSTTSIYFSQFFSYLYVCVPLHAKYLKDFLYVSLLFKKLSIKLY
jgi:hypothetical protein